jgi:putative N6-adenine-specific DNA methylase
MALNFFSPCPRGLEPVLADELRTLGASAVVPVSGGVSFGGDWLTCYRANLESRIATRVLWRVAEGRYRREDDIYRVAYACTWGKWFTPDQSMRVHVSAQKSPLKSLEFVTLRIKDAICDHFRGLSGRRPNIDTADPDIRVHAFLTADAVSLYLDTSGEPLYKRGFKHAAVEAPLKENLAAGILALTGWRPDQALVDPMCGSGTFLIEAAHIALRVAPGLGRSFAFETLKTFDLAGFATLRRELLGRQQGPAAIQIHGSDIAADQVRRSLVNLRAAGLAGRVVVDEIDLLELRPPAAAGVMVANPPYGVRLGEEEELAAFYPLLGTALKRNWAGWNCFFLTADPALPKGVGLKPSRRTPLFNGALECRLFEYRMVAGSVRRRPGESPGGATGDGQEKKRSALRSFSSPARGPASDDVEVLDPGAEVLVAMLAAELDRQAQVVDRVGIAQRVLVGDQVVLVELEQRLVEGLHAEFAGAFHDLLDLGNLALED